MKYTSPAVKKTHLAGKKHARTCKLKGVPVCPEGEESVLEEKCSQEPAAKKQKTTNVTPSTSKSQPVSGEIEPYKILEKQAAEAYEEYKMVAITDPLRGQGLYLKYHALYKAYECEFTKFTGNAQ